MSASSSSSQPPPSPSSQPPPSPSSQPRFAMDISLFRYAKQLRLLGCDVLCSENYKQQALVDIAEQEKRIIVTSVGKTIPLLFRYTLLGDLTSGKAFENVKTVRDGKSGKSLVQIKKRRGRKNNQNDSDSDEDNHDDIDSESDTSHSDDENRDTNYFGAAAILGDPQEENNNNDPRKFHWVEEEDPETKMMKKRRRRLVGYNSDGESDFEYEDEKKTEMKLNQLQEVSEERKKKAELRQERKQQKDRRRQDDGDSSALISTEKSNHQLHQQALYNRLTTLVQGAKPGSVAAIAANACNFALLRAQKQIQNSNVKFIIVDIHANFKQMLSAIILIAGVSWIPSILFTRCVKCNVKISSVPKESVKGVVTDSIYRLYENFYQCSSCKNVFWGVDNGLVVNFKSARTTEYLRSLFEDGVSATPSCAANSQQQQPSSSFDDDQENTENVNNTSLDRRLVTNTSASIAPPRSSRQAAQWGQMPRHIFSFPRKIKVVIFDFMTHDEMDNLVAACPMFRELVDKKKRGLDMKFVPDMKKKKKEKEAAAAAAAKNKEKNDDE